MDISDICKYLDEDYMLTYSLDNGINKITFVWKEYSKHIDKSSDFMKILDECISYIPFISFTIEIIQNSLCSYMDFTVNLEYYSINKLFVCFDTEYKVHLDNLTLDDIKKVSLMMSNMSGITNITGIKITHVIDKINKTLSTSDKIKYSVESKRRYCGSKDEYTNNKVI